MVHDKVTTSNLRAVIYMVNFPPVTLSCNSWDTTLLVIYLVSLPWKDYMAKQYNFTWNVYMRNLQSYYRWFTWLTVSMLRGSTSTKQNTHVNLSRKILT